MTEIADSSVDIVVFAPPYNIDTHYSDTKNYDYKSFEEYKVMMNRIIAECFRVLRPDGVFLNESADTIYSKGKLIALSGLIQKMCIDNGFTLRERHINFLQSDNGVELLDKEHNWSKDYFSTEDSHSNCHQWFLMSKNPSTKFDAAAGKIFYVNYPANEEGHPCPFSSEHIRIFLDLVSFRAGATVLEPFMGTSRMGREVIKRGGKYIGYELESTHFKTAQGYLSTVK